MPKVSVIVPVYNCEPYLKKCLDSLVYQTLNDIEIIVVNDGSPDNSQQIIDEYAFRYPNVKAYKKENGGLSDARNYGIARATGDFIGFVDSDDYVERDMFENMYKLAILDSSDVVMCDFYIDYPDHSYILKADLGYTTNQIKSYIISYPNAQARLIKRQIIEQHLFRKGIRYEDLDLMPTLPLYANKISFSDMPYYHYIQRENSIMHQKVANDKELDITEVLKDVYNAYKKEGQLENYHDELEYLFITHLQRTALLRLASLENGKKYYKEIQSMMKQYYPNWSKNPYLKKSSWKFQLVCLLGKLRLYPVLKLIQK